MKTESTVKFVLRLALTLLAITAVVAVLLAAVNFRALLQMASRLLHRRKKA